jgi:hypothetical protein
MVVEGLTNRVASDLQHEHKSPTPFLRDLTQCDPWALQSLVASLEANFFELAVATLNKIVGDRAKVQNTNRRTFTTFHAVSLPLRSRPTQTWVSLFNSSTHVGQKRKD